MNPVRACTRFLAIVSMSSCIAGPPYPRPLHRPFLRLGAEVVETTTIDDVRVSRVLERALRLRCAAARSAVHDDGLLLVATDELRDVGESRRQLLHRDVRRVW